VGTTSVGFERDFDGVFSPEQHGLEGQKALVACFVRLFVAMQSRMGFVVQPKFVVPTKLGCRSWLGSERAMTEIVVPTKLTDGLKGSRCRSLQQRNFVFRVRAIFVSVPVRWASLFRTKFVYP
jgi:hypothetical protein